MHIPTFEQLHAEGLLDEAQLKTIKDCSKQPVSLHWELKTLLYVGVLALTTGLGIVVYENIDTIGHVAILLFIASASAACFGYCLRKAAGFSFHKVPSPTVLFDYVLLLGCLLLLIFIGYLQFQYNVFGNRLGMATFIPMVILFLCAYYFDHLGILSLAIVNLAAWLGITVTPLHMWQRNDFSNTRIIYTGLFLGVLLLTLSLLSVQKKIKPHFAFTYKNFGTHILLISALAAIVHFDMFYLLLFVVFSALAYYFFSEAVKDSSFYFLVTATLYFYITLSYVLIHFILGFGSIDEAQVYLILFYLIGSGVGLIVFLMRYNKLLKQNDSIH